MQDAAGVRRPWTPSCSDLIIRSRPQQQAPVSPKPVPHHCEGSVTASAYFAVIVCQLTLPRCPIVSLSETQDWDWLGQLPLRWTCGHIWPPPLQTASLWSWLLVKTSLARISGSCVAEHLTHHKELLVSSDVSSGHSRHSMDHNISADIRANL